VRLRSTTALLACVVLVAACSGNSKPQVLPTLPPTPTATAASNLSVTIPVSAKPATSVGAAAFVEFYFESLNRAYRQGVHFPLADLSAPTCKSCANFSGVADQLARERHHFLGDTFTDIDAEAPPLVSGQSYVLLSCALPSRDEADAAGRVVKHHKAERPLALTVVTVRRGDGWIVRAMTSS
jgi:hypothetical protein